MASKKKRTSTRRRTRRMSGTMSGVETLAAVGAGVVAGKLLAKVIPSTVNPTIVGAGMIVAGVFVPKFIKGNFGAGMGMGVAAIGISNTLTNLGVLSGTGGNNGYRIIQQPRINGMPSNRIPTIGAPAAGGGRIPTVGAVRRGINSLSGVDDGAPSMKRNNPFV